MHRTHIPVRSGEEPQRPEPKPLRQHPEWSTIHDGTDECTDDICCCEPEPRWQRLAEEMEREKSRNP